MSITEEQRQLLITLVKSIRLSFDEAEALAALLGVNMEDYNLGSQE